MKKIFSMIAALAAAMIMSGCNGVVSGDLPSNGYDNGSGGEYRVDVDKVYLPDLYDGYCIQGHQSNGHDVDLGFDDKSDYIYIRYGDGKFNGQFDITNSGYSISFYDNDGGSYRIDTDDGYLHKGFKYDISGIGRDIIIDDILRGKCEI